jgi:hypothetical protein
MWTDPTRSMGCLVLAVVVGAGCGGAQQAAAAPMRPLEESRAIEVVLEGFQQASVPTQLHRRIQLPHDKQMEIDVATDGHDHGVEYVSAQDRVDFGDVLPQRRSPDALVTLTGAGDDARVDVLVLDEREYLYEPDPERAGPGHPSQVEVEDRLRQSVIDYLTYLRQHREL